MHATLVLNVVGLTPALVGAATPGAAAVLASGGARPLATVGPAVTCSMQATFMTGLAPRDHGIVGNGWLFRDLMEVWFWRQSNHLVAGEKIWETAKRRDPSFTCANLCWWYNMASAHDIGLTPRPIYKADGRKLPDCYTKPDGLRGELTAALGPFPLFQYWGPGASIASSRWIAEAARHVVASRRPTLTLVYLPHLDYDLQRLGPDDPRIAKALGEIDAVVGDLVDLAAERGLRVLLLSEYGMSAVRRPVHINRALREAGFLAVREEDGLDMLDVHASRALAVADHQLAHVYVAEPGLVAEVARVLAALPGVEAVLEGPARDALSLDHPRSGELVVVAQPDAWFTYYHWLDDARAPDFARLVEIHRKPGYDPVELFLDPAIRAPKAAIGWRLLKRKLGLRTLMDVIPLDATLVRGSHGRPIADPAHGPLIASSEPSLLGQGPVSALAVRDLALAHVFGA